MRRALTLVTFAGLAVGLTACGSGGTTTTETTEPTTTSSSTSSVGDTGSGTATSDTTDGTTASGSGATETSTGDWTFTKDADGGSVASVKEKTGKNSATLDFVHDPSLLGRDATLKLPAGTRESCALGFETRISVDGAPPTAVQASNVDGRSDVVLFEGKKVWQQLSPAKSVVIEVPTGPNCRAASAEWTTYEFDFTGAQNLPMDEAWTR